jgi:hypothetical protein
VKVAAAPAEAPTGVKPDDEKPAPEERPAGDSTSPKSEPSRSEPAPKMKRGQFPVVIKTDPEGTRVTTGRHVFGTTPLTLKLRPGNSYEFTFTKAGYTSASRRFRFDSEEPQTLRVTLKRSAPEPKKSSAPAPVAKTAPPPPPPPKKGFFAR